ncbi:cell wall-binding repeat-containing protein [Metaclostridioides mangenotii]|uniref:cell wall-binding repeat-containing protein n=1 Tax=Metaclostridioides mangenotii TaxID=1540 RepID=UPI0028E409A8|nr:cell wall-binding repeat-containing protein [Clostridioides mangenotii]
MSKKRNLAVLMAAATVATSVAPVFADTTGTLDGKTVSVKDSAKLDELKKEVEGYLNTRYTTDKDLLKGDGEAAGKCVYEIKAQYNSTTAADVASMRDLEREIAKLNDANDTITVTVKDLGHKEVAGKILDNEVKTYKSAEITALKNLITSSTPGVTGVDSDANAIYLTLQNNTERLVLKVGEEKTFYNSGTVEAPVLGAKDPIYKEDGYGNKLDKDGKVTTTPADYVVIGFEKNKENISDIEDLRTFTISNAETVESVKATDLYNLDLNKLTQEGNDVAKFIRDYNAATPSGHITVDPTSTATKLVLKVPVNKDGVENKFTTLSITGTVKEIAGIKNGLKVETSATPLSIKTLAGANREATAIEVSKDLYADDAAKNVVLVSGYSIADGLTATPFAKTKTAPILLTGKDKISKDVMDEIKRVMKDGGTVYLVGGTNSLSADIETQLDNKFINFERIAGTNRMDTSLKIAQSMVKEKDATTFKNFDELYVAGGYAEADAMSIASIAAQGKTIANVLNDGADPILLTDKNGLTADQKAWLNRQSKIDRAYIAGGENSVPTTVSADLRNITSSVSRLSGDNRQATNAKVIKEFYAEGASKKLYVAKSDNNGLVDALPSGLLAAKDEAPIVLATDELSAAQDSALTNIKAQLTAVVNNKETKVQVGNGIADKVWTAINKVLGLD